jgi:NADH dehydrogenase FAD-containing subunit
VYLRQTVISPHNYFLYTPLLPSVTVGTLEARSIIQPTRFITRHKKRKVNVIEAEAKEVDPVSKTVTFEGKLPPFPLSWYGRDADVGPTCVCVVWLNRQL